VNDGSRSWETYTGTCRRNAIFPSLGIAETAEALGVSAVTVTRDWQAARAWLARELGAGADRIAVT